MTLIAGFMKNECPILLGDLLISSSKIPNNELVIPALGKVSSVALMKAEYRPSSLVQKINLFSPRLALAWSGNLLEAQRFFGELTGAGLHLHPSYDGIMEIYKDTAPSDLTIIGILRDENNVTLFDINAQVFTSPSKDIKWFKGGGSGFNSLLKVFPELHSELTSGQLTNLEVGISTAIEIANRLLVLELQSASSIQMLFGAGYEILHPLHDGLAKFSDLTYYFWVTEETDQKIWRLQLPFLAMKYSYFGDFLVIRTVRFKYATQH